MDRSKRILILGLGNTVMTDDGVGVYAVRKVREYLDPNDAIDTVEAEIAGFALLDLLEGYPSAVIIDAVSLPDLAPGEIVLRGIEAFEPTSHLMTAHQIDLPTAIALGRQLERDMPRQVAVVGVQAADDHTLGETCTDAVQAAIEPAARQALEIARSWLGGN